jgi:hypothetical protein
MDLDLNPAVPVAMVFGIPILAVLGGFVFLIVRTVLRARVRELEIRERIAMIERGLVPPPEVDPKGFDRAMLMHQYVTTRRPPARYRHRRAGVTMIGVGLGLVVLLGFTADVSIGMGVGGFLMILGVAFFINSLLESDPRVPPPNGTAPPPPPPPFTPPSER